MMRYLLDTNAIITLLNDQNSAVAQRTRRLEPRDVGISAIVAQQLFYGAFKSRTSAANVDLIDRLPLEVVEFDREDARSSGEIRADLSIRGAPIGPYDILIAGQARARDLILITRNTREFSRVEGLRTEDWEQPIS